MYEYRFDERLKPKVEVSTRLSLNIVSYESIKRGIKTRPIYECRCDERLKPKGEDEHCMCPVVYY